MTQDRLIVRRRIGDVETPVGAALKLGPDEPGAFIFESIAGGERLGRYSFIGLNPDVWLRVQHGVAETASRADFSDAERFDGDPVAAIRFFAGAARATCDEDLPPMASGAFGYVGYDMIRHIEPVTITSPDDLGVPEALLARPREVIIFDHLYQQILLVARTPFGEEGAAAARLDAIERRLDQPTPMVPVGRPPEPLDFTSNTTKARYFEMVERARRYTIAGDIFQVVPSQRFSTPFSPRSLSLYRSLRRLNPSAFMFHMSFGDLRLVGSSPEIMVRVRDGRVAIRPIAGTRPRSGDPAEDARRAQSLLDDEKEMAEHLMLL
ncbi:MAG: chorismate-binding protein, partial [Pseudomonadota bacterium]